MDDDNQPETSEFQDAGPYATGLWARVREWLWRWSAVFSPEEIIRDGLSRRLALRCCAWLAPLEAAVRRLVIAAALALDPAQLSLARSAASGKSRRQLPSRKTARPVSFRLFSIRAANASRGAASPLSRKAPPPRHLPFPGDCLLRLGAARSLRHRPPSLRRPHPLVRSGRIFPYDPDYIPTKARSKPLRSVDHQPGARADATAARRSSRTRVYAETFSPDEWRRVEGEWDRILPAPGLAARIEALARVLDEPGRRVQWLARRLIARPGLASMLCGLPAPLMRRPAYDRLGPQVDEDILPLCHAAIDPPDTS